MRVTDDGARWISEKREAPAEWEREELKSRGGIRIRSTKKKVLAFGWTLAGKRTKRETERGGRAKLCAFVGGVQQRRFVNFFLCFVT